MFSVLLMVKKRFDPKNNFSQHINGVFDEAGGEA
jgi:hypothetical protein